MQIARYGAHSANPCDASEGRAMGDPIEIMVRGYELTLRVDDAKKIEVRAEEDKK